MKRIIFLFFIIIIYQQKYAQLIAINGRADYPFWLNLPPDSILKNKPPVLIFLHGRSLSGTDLNLVKKYGVISEIIKGRKIQAVVVAPQTTNGWEPSKILSVLNYVQKTYPTDSCRVYVVGMSLGGYGTLFFAGQYPHKVAAAVALCGGGNVSDACNLATLPIWIQHGTLDEAVPLEESIKIVQAIKKCNGGEFLKYTPWEGANHGALEKVFRSDEMYQWLFQFSKSFPDL